MDLDAKQIEIHNLRKALRTLYTLVGTRILFHDAPMRAALDEAAKVLDEAPDRPEIIREVM